MWDVSIERILAVTFCVSARCGDKFDNLTAANKDLKVKKSSKNRNSFHPAFESLDKRIVMDGCGVEFELDFAFWDGDAGVSASAYCEDDEGNRDE